MSLVSVIVATYKRDKELKRALESLSNQSYVNIEIVLVDDNANHIWNEKVEKIVNEFTNMNPSININYIVNKENKGSANTRNVGINLAKGDYVTFLDDDDFYLPDKVKNQVDFMVKGNYDYSVTDLILLNEEGIEIDKRTRAYIKDFSKQSMMKYHLKYHITGTDTMMFKKEYIQQIGGFASIDVGDEFYLMQRAIENGGKFGYLNKCDVKAYVHTGEGGLSSGNGKIQGENALYEYKKEYFKQLSKKDVKYIKARHYAVIAYAEVRRSHYLSCLINIIKAFFISPIDLFKILKK